MHTRHKYNLCLFLLHYQSFPSHHVVDLKENCNFQMMSLHTYHDRIQHPNSDLKIKIGIFIFNLSIWKWGYFGLLASHASSDFYLFLLNCICLLYSEHSSSQHSGLVTNDKMLVLHTLKPLNFLWGSLTVTVSATTTPHKATWRRFYWYFSIYVWRYIP